MILFVIGGKNPPSKLRVQQGKNGQNGQTDHKKFTQNSYPAMKKNEVRMHIPGTWGMEVTDGVAVPVCEGGGA